MMLPAVTLQLTATLAESPVLMNPTAVKSAVAFWRRVRVLGETNRSAIVLPGWVARTGNSHATIAAVTSPARDARTTRSFSRARRDDSLCLNVMGLAPSWVCASRIEELAHVGRRGRSAGEDVHAEAFENEPQRARVLVRRGGLVSALRLGTDRRPVHTSTAQRVVAARLVEHDDQQAVLLEHWAGDQRRDVGLQPAVGRAQGARSEEHTSELQSRLHLVCRLLLEKKKKEIRYITDKT